VISTSLINRVLDTLEVEAQLDPAVIGSVHIDSRKVMKNDLFLAFNGEHTDGHDYVEKVAERGAFSIGSESIDAANYVKVDDVQDFLALLAAEFRKLDNTKSVAITGSSGKTSTRSFAVSMLKSSGKIVHFTHGNLNNHLGMPLTMLNKPLYADVTVLEMGMNHTGEIKLLTEIAKPEIALITNIGYAHIGNFDSMNELVLAKLELFNYSDALCIVNMEDSYLEEWALQNSERDIVKYFPSKNEASLAMPEFMVENFSAASAISQFLGADNRKFVKAAIEVEIPPLRGETVEKEGKTFKMDCYNANPESMQKSIKSFIEENRELENIYLILGEMGELGKFSEKFHRELVKKLKSFKIKQAFLVGEEFEKVVRGNIEEENSGIIEVFSTVEQVALVLPENGRFLLKGSRSNRLEKILDYLGS